MRVRVGRKDLPAVASEPMRSKERNVNHAAIDTGIPWFRPAHS
jgi:hypothetical protein